MRGARGVLIVMAASLLLVLFRFYCVSQLYAEVFWSGKPESNQVALTFDDGPDPETTPKILEIFRQKGGRATFFCIGENVLKYPEIARQIVYEGHEIGNHTHQHLNLRDLKSNFKKILFQIHDAQRAIYCATGIWPRIFRPPYSSTNDAINCLIASAGIRVIIWSISPADYEGPTPEAICGHVLSEVKGGSIVVLHDNCDNTVETLPALLDGLRTVGLEAATVSELIN